MVELDYLVIGHVTRDLVGDAFTAGGTAAYAARTARSLGCRVGVVTSTGGDLELASVLDGVRLAHLASETTTTFENSYTAGERRQMLRDLAAPLSPQAVPADWEASIVHVGPVAGECAPELVDGFRDAFVGLTPQGWMRRWDQAGRVSYRPWGEAERLLARADAVVLSEEDVAEEEGLVMQYAAQTPLLVLTQGAAGCTVYHQGEARRFPAPAVRQVDPTGSGDIFAAAFFVWLQRAGDPWAAARFANCVAAGSVTRRGLAGTPSPGEIARCEAAGER